jgi:regulator of protease activity HflC (stomatin/prohibitin superfamily)
MPLADILFETLRAISPVLVVRTQQAGVDFRWGKAQSVALAPGAYWRCPYIREIEVVPTAVEWVDMPMQGIVTADDKPVAVSLNMAFRVTDAVRWHVEVRDAEHAIMNALRPEVAEVVSAYEYDTLRERVPAVGRLIRAKSQRAVRRLGAVALDVGLSDFVPARHYRLLQDTVVS